MKTKLTISILLFITAANLSFAQKKVQVYKHGDLRADLKLPYVNYLALHPDNAFRDAEFGFIGFGIGFGYNYKDKKFVEAGSSFAMTFELPFPAPIDASYNKILSSAFISLTDNLIRKRFTFGYGLSYTVNTWKEWYRDFDTMNFSAYGMTKSRRSITNRDIGLVLNSYYRISKTLNIGLIYQPSLLKINGRPQFIYEHLISLEVNWRIKLINMRRNK